MDGLTAKTILVSIQREWQTNHRKYAQRIDAVCFEIWGYLFRYCDFYRLLSDFASQAVLVLKPLVYLTDIILGLLAVGIIFYLLRRLIFAEEKTKKAIYVALVLVLGFYFVGEIVGVRFLPALAWFVVPSPWDTLLMTGASGALILWQWKEEFGRAFIFPIVAFLVVGFLHRWTLAQGVQNLGMTVLLPTVIIVFGLVIYYWFYDSCFEKNRTESDK